MYIIVHKKNTKFKRAKTGTNNQFFAYESLLNEINSFFNISSQILCFSHQLDLVRK